MKSLLVLVVFVLVDSVSAQESDRSFRGSGRRPVAGSEGGRAAGERGWTARMVEEIRRSEYRLSELAPGVFTAPNRSQELRMRVNEKGLEVFPRSADVSGVGARWRVSLRTRSFGRLDDARPLARATVSAREDRAELEHGLLLEWFENGEGGIEQGWTIAARPAGTEPLAIGLAVAGDLSLRIEEGARSGVLVDSGGAAVLRYRDLRAFDATGRALEARLEPSPDGVRIEIDDAAAAYPLTVDPILTGPAWMAESDQANADLGNSVATAGDVNADGYDDVIVGANFFDHGQTNEGRAFVYLGSAAGLATSPAWTAESNQASASFGKSVATAGDVNGDGYSDVIVGAPFGGLPSVGRALVYLGSATGLETTPSWVAAPLSGTTGVGNSLFGDSVATAGDVNGDGYSDVIVGAPEADSLNNDEDSGAAYVYLGSATGLETDPVFSAESGFTTRFGNSVSTAGDVNGDGYDDVIVGDPNFSMIFVYRGSDIGPIATPWTRTTAQVQTWFGWSVATAGDVNGDGYGDVIVGAYSYDNGQTNEGRAFVYLGSPSGPGASPAWTTESDQADASYGWSVGGAGDVNGDGYSDVVVGAYAFDNGQNAEGRAHVFLGSATGLATSPAWTAEADQDLASLGWSVGGAGDVNGDGSGDVVVGAPGFDNDLVNEGRAFAYLGSATGLASAPAWTGEGEQAGADLGISVATAGDVNGDGYGDVILGADLFDNGQTDEGRASVYLGSTSGLATSAAWTVEGDQVGAHLGNSVATAGDVNGDGYSDVMVGASLFDNGQTDEGRALVYLGTISGLATSAAWTVEGNQPNAFLGTAVAASGDVNGDGYSDVIVGAPGFDNGELDEGRALAFLGSATGLSSSPAWTAESDQAGARFGQSVATAGDVDGDGDSDVIVGADLFDDGEADEGRAYLFSGSPTGLSASPSWTAEPDQASASFGHSVSTAGDVNGDGYSDVIVGAPAFDDGEADEGRAFVFQGSATGLSTSAAWTAESDQVGAAFGHSVATAGDVNGDGTSDVIVGAPQFTNGETMEGRASVYLGSAGGLAASPAWTAESDQVDARMGTSVSMAGDVNGDGYGDALASAASGDDGQSDEGLVFVYLGNDGRGGRVRALQQRSTNDAHPIALLGRTGGDGLFRIRAQFRKNLKG